MITKPMLAYNGEWSLDDITYPVLASEKLDGIRLLRINGKLRTRALKPIPNKHIKKTILSLNLPDNVDGEIVIRGASFHQTQSAVMSIEGEPDFNYVIFDWVKEHLTTPYWRRIQHINDGLFSHHQIAVFECKNKEDLTRLYRNLVVVGGAEGLILRTPTSPYKCGRSTLNEQYMLKYVEWTREEATVIGFEEEMQNMDTRTNYKSNLHPTSTLGALVVRSNYTGAEFKIGSGFTREERKEIWNNKHKYVNSALTFKYKNFGVVDKPRTPIFVGFRDERDLIISDSALA